MVSPDALSLPEDLRRRFQEWIAFYDDRPLESAAPFDVDRFDAVGRQLARDLQAFVRPEVVVHHVPERGLFSIRPLSGSSPGISAWVRDFIAERWGAEIVVAHGVVYRPHELPGFMAQQRGELIGLLTFQITDDACEIVTLDSVRPGVGVGTALIEAVKNAARVVGCRRLWLITTNDNLEALRFYQKRGFTLVAVHRNAVEVSRRLKPEISPVGAHGIPIRDEMELELLFH